MTKLIIDQSFNKGPKEGDQFLVVHEASNSVVGSVADEGFAKADADERNARAKELGSGATYSVTPRP